MFDEILVINIHISFIFISSEEMHKNLKSIFLEFIICNLYMGYFRFILFLKSLKFNICTKIKFN